MKKYFAQLRPMERRLAVGVAVVLILVLNWVYIWPHFSDWGKLQSRRTAANKKLDLYHKAIAEIPTLQKEVNALQNQGEFVPPEDQAFNFLRLIQSQAVQSGVGIVNQSRAQTRTNDVFFIEQVQNMQVVATDDQLVDFLYKLGSGGSMIRVRGLEMQPDVAHQHLSAQIQLVASYQKKPPVAAAVKTNAPAAARTATPAAKPGATAAPANAKTNLPKPKK
ncbi:MAG TPA: hypothetical protein VFV23_01395 [Verrucomicrobiae bacterium]|nr:hypothetical protein [Verrucomicrobiae bacterium]